MVLTATTTIVIINIIGFIKYTHFHCPHPDGAAQRPRPFHNGHSLRAMGLCVRCHGDSASPQSVRPQGQGGRCRCSCGPHLQACKPLAASPGGRREQSEGALLKPLPAVPAVCSGGKRRRPTGGVAELGQPARSPEFSGADRLESCDTVMHGRLLSK